MIQHCGMLLGPSDGFAWAALNWLAAMDRKIVGFHQDKEQHWVGQLECRLPQMRCSAAQRVA
jgi:hypothetical protein